MVVVTEFSNTLKTIDWILLIDCMAYELYLNREVPPLPNDTSLHSVPSRTLHILFPVEEHPSPPSSSDQGQASPQGPSPEPSIGHTGLQRPVLLASCTVMGRVTLSDCSPSMWDKCELVGLKGGQFRVCPDLSAQ